MGWGTKFGLFVLALVAASFGGWIITIPVLVIVFLPPLLQKRGKNRQVGSAPVGGRGGVPLQKMLGAFLLVLSLVAFASGGTFSPLVSGSAGLLLLFRPRLGSRFSSSVKPVRHSVLLRRSVLPFSWSAIVEAKVSTREPEGALSGVAERLLLTLDPAPKIFLIFSAFAFSRQGAEDGILARIRHEARALGPLGVYLLPLDSVEAVTMSRIRAGRLEVPDKNLRQFLSAADYGAIAVEAQSGFVTKFEIYGRSDQGRETTSSLSELRGKATGSIMLRELLGEAVRKIGTPQPDRYVTFLSSMAATEGETFGQRIIEAAQGTNQEVLLVSSLSSPQVELSRAQLRAIARVYE